VWLRAFDGFRQFPDADRSIVVDAGRFGGLQLGIAAWFEPLSGKGFVAESYGAYGACRVAILAGLAARRIGAEQTARSFFLEMHSFIHSVSIFVLPTKIVIFVFLWKKVVFSAILSSFVANNPQNLRITNRKICGLFVSHIQSQSN
jgi:hypothetical protein